MITTGDILQHAGVKGMRWGVRKTGKQVAERVKSEVKSRKRELQWVNTARKADKMSTKDLMKVANRIQTENEFKRLTKTKFSKEIMTRKLLGDKTLANKTDKQNYRNRGDFSDAELKRKVNRLRAKDQFGKAMMSASKEQVDLGKSIVKKYGKSDLKDNVARTMARSRSLSVVDGARMTNVIN